MAHSDRPAASSSRMEPLRRFRGCRSSTCSPGASAEARTCRYPARQRRREQSTGSGPVIVSCRTTVPAGELVVAAEVARILEKRAALKHPPVSLAVSDAVALGIAGIFRSRTEFGRVLERFFRHGSIDSAQLLE